MVDCEGAVKQALMRCVCVFVEAFCFDSRDINYDEANSAQHLFVRKGQREVV